MATLVSSVKAADKPTKSPNLEVTEVEGGLVVYQDRPERVHYLNNTAAFVFELADGELTIGEIAEQMGSAFSLGGPALAEVAECVDLLREKGLLK